MQNLSTSFGYTIKRLLMWCSFMYSVSMQFKLSFYKKMFMWCSQLNIFNTKTKLSGNCVHKKVHYVLLAVFHGSNEKCRMSKNEKVHSLLTWKLFRERIFMKISFEWGVSNFSRKGLTFFLKILKNLKILKFFEENILP
jgi:hypothetical protein